MKKKYLNYILIAVVLILWVLIAVRIFNAVRSSGGGEDISGESMDLKIGEPDRKFSDTLIRIVYHIARDPFIPAGFRTTPVETAPAVKAPEKKPVGISYRIAGIIVNNDRRLIMLEDRTNNKTVYLYENGQYLNLKILKIAAESVTLEEFGTKKEIKLERK